MNFDLKFVKSVGAFAVTPVYLDKKFFSFVWEK